VSDFDNGDIEKAADRISTQEYTMTTLTIRKTAPPEWLLAFWKEIDEKTFGKGFDCFAEDATCRLGVAEWDGLTALLGGYEIQLAGDAETRKDRRSHRRWRRALVCRQMSMAGLNQL
jgi:hypothetical protein